MKFIIALMLIALNSSAESVEEFLNSIPDSAPYMTMEEAEAQVHAKYKPCWNDRQCRNSELCIEDSDGRFSECINLDDPSRSTR